MTQHGHCPAGHGRMFDLPTGRWFCSHSAHYAAGESGVYEADCVTPAKRLVPPGEPVGFLPADGLSEASCLRFPLLQPGGAAA